MISICKSISYFDMIYRYSISNNISNSDDLEVTNAVGSSRTKHKLSMYSFRNILFYFSFM